MLKAVIFDMDGVIADTEPLHERSRDILLEKLGLDVAALSPRAFAKSKRTFWGEVAAEYHLPYTAEELTLREFDVLIGIAKDSGLRPTDGLLQALQDLRAQGLRTAVASSSDREYVEIILKITGTASFFDSVSCGNEVKAAKPAPDVYLNALEKLGIRAEEALAVEDSDTGSAAAAAAGIRCIGYDVVSDEKFRQKLSGCFCKIRDMREVAQIAAKFCREERGERAV